MGFGPYLLLTNTSQRYQWYLPAVDIFSGYGVALLVQLGDLATSLWPLKLVCVMLSGFLDRFQSNDDVLFIAKAIQQ